MHATAWDAAQLLRLKFSLRQPSCWKAMTLGELFPGKLGRVQLTRVAVRLRRPDLLKLALDAELEAELLQKLQTAMAAVKEG